jgi:inner membrane protein
MVGLATGAAVSKGPMSVRFWVLSVLCCVLADADVLAFKFGIPYSHMFGHRGFFHSLFFALMLGIFVAFAFFPQGEIFSRTQWTIVAYFVLLAASHGLLDSLTNGGLGIALLSPFDNARYFFPIAPIEVSPISARGFFTYHGLRVLMSEFVWVWIPVLAVTLFIRWRVRPEFFPQL